MSDVFIDTSFLIAAARRRDQHHAVALRWKASLKDRRFLTTDYVVLEFMDASAHLSMRARSLAIAQILRRDPRVRVVPCSDALMEDGVRAFGKHTDKEWGLTDCISFEVMRQNGIRDALTNDHHFEQAGFRAPASDGANRTVRVHD